MEFYKVYRSVEGTDHFIEFEGFETLEESKNYVKALIEEDKEEGKKHDYEVDYKEKTVAKFHVSKGVNHEVTY